MTKVMAMEESITVKNLEPGEYVVKIAKIQGSNINEISSGWSEPIFITLPTKANLPPPIKNFEIIDIQYDNAKIQWDHYNNVTYFINILDENDNPVQDEKPIKVSEVNIFFNFLHIFFQFF